MPDMKDEYQLVIIGAGPGGYVAAIRAAQLGVETLVVEKQYLGGTCQNVGCIPSKELLTATELYEQVSHAADFGITAKDVSIDTKKLIARKNKTIKAGIAGINFLFKQNGVHQLEGTAAFDDDKNITVTVPGGGRKRIRFEHCIIACGTGIIELPFLPFADKDVLSSTTALELESIPETLAVIGAGPIGLELGTVYRRLGSKIDVIEMLPTILPGMDKDLTAQGEVVFKKQGMNFHLDTKVASSSKKSGKFELNLVDAKDNASKGTLVVDKVLVAIGRRPDTARLELEKAGVQVDARGFIMVDEQMRTNKPHIFATGDVTGGKLLAHKASREGEVAAEVIAGRDSYMDYRCLPGVVYTEPEVASVGLTEDEAVEKGLKVKVGRFPFSASGRARTMGVRDGFVKVIADEPTGEILGVHILGPRASELIAEATAAMALDATAEDLGEVIHSHPTLSEALMEAALAAEGRAIHIPNK